MRTDDLITALAADLPNRPTSVPRAIATALGLSFPMMVAILLLGVGIRPGLEGMLTEPKILLKFVFTLGLFAAGLWLALRITRPGTGAGAARLALAAVFALLGVAVVYELATMPSVLWRPAMVGTYAVPCLALIALFSVTPFMALMIALRAGAPDSPTLAGAAGGLVAGSLAAAVYATHCVEDSALFMATWYVLGIAAVTVLGAAVGRIALRW
jgi:hypothetical protein